MADVNVTNLGELLKRIYASWDIEDLLNLTHPALATMFAEGSASLGGVGFYFPVRAQGNFAHAFIAEAGALPTGQNTVVRQALVNPMVHAGVVTLTGLGMAMSSGDAAAFARAYDENVQELIRSMTQYKEGCAFRDGFGRLATFVTEPDGALGLTALGELIFDDVSQVNVGMKVDILDTDGVTIHDSGVTVLAVDWATKSIQFSVDIAAAAATGDFVILDEAGTLSATVAHEPIGVEGALLASGTYLGVSRATYPAWSANTFAASSLFDEEVIQRARVRLTQASGIQLSGMSGRLKIITHPMQAEILFRLAIPRIQFSGANGIDLLNSSEVKVGGIPVVTSYLAPASKAYLGDWKYAMSLYPPTGKLHIDTEFNGSALKWLAGFDRGQVFVKEYCAFAVKRPNAFIRITSLTEATR
jgi:hypothetical protein